MGINVPGELLKKKMYKKYFYWNKKYLPDGELNPGLPRDRRGYSPLYYRGYITCEKFKIIF